jgi:hypothetical protein
MWEDCKDHYGVITAQIMCIRYLDMQARSTDAEEMQFCEELSEAMAMDAVLKGQPYYPRSFDYARNNGEEALYHSSDAVNTRCAVEIVDAINACRYLDGSYKLEPAVRAIMMRHNTERVCSILAVEVRRNPRAFSDANQEWAQGFNVETGFVSMVGGTNTGALEKFITGFRDMELQERLRKAAEYIIRECAAKPSVLKQLRDAEKAPKPPRKPKNPKKQKDGAEL